MRLKGGVESFDGVVFDVERDFSGGMVPDDAIEKLWQKIPFGPRVKTIPTAGDVVHLGWRHCVGFGEYGCNQSLDLTAVQVHANARRTSAVPWIGSDSTDSESNRCAKC